MKAITISDYLNGKIEPEHDDFVVAKSEAIVLVMTLHEAERIINRYMRICHEHKAFGEIEKTIKVLDAESG